jgi:conjugative transfer pilus assembly protein TraH
MSVLKNRYWKFVLLISTMGSVDAVADIGQDLDNFVSNMNAQSSMTAAQNFEAQGYRYATGGRFLMRAPTQPIRLGTFKAPNYRIGGCGSIDLFGGSMSFISANELVNTLQNIGSSALPSYAFMLAMRVISSQITDSLQEVFDWMQKMNNLQTSTCEAASWAFNSALNGQLLSRDQNICIDQAMHSNGETYFDASRRCTIAGSGREGTLNTPEAKEKGFINGNLAWYILTKANMFPNDLDMREAIMSLTGTLVLTKEDAGGNIANGDENAQPTAKYYKSVLKNPPEPVPANYLNLMDAMLYGGATDVYRCFDGQGMHECQDVRRRVVNWDDGTNTVGNYVDDALVPRARGILESIFYKIRNKQNITNQERNWVNATSLPVYRLLTVGAALKGDSGLSFVDGAAQAMAIDFFNQYMNQLIDTMISNAHDPLYDPYGEGFRASLYDLKEIVQDLYDNSKGTIERGLQMAENVQFYERLAVSSMPNSIQASLAWAGQFNAE